MKSKILLRPWGVAAALAIATFLLYLPTAKFDFVNFGDDTFVVDNAYVYSGLNSESIKWSFTRVRDGNWNPLTWISHMADCELWGPEPGPAHLVNAGLHALNVTLLFLLLYSMTGALWRCALVAALFAWHPLHVEAVAWISQRKLLLTTLFGFLAMWSYVSHARKPSIFRLAAVVIFFGLSILAGPAFVALPILLLLLDFWPLRRFQPPGLPSAPANSKPPLFQPASPGKLLLEKLPLFALSGVAALFAFAAYARDPLLKTLNAPMSLCLENALVSSVTYLGKMVFPANLFAFYPYPASIPIWQVAGAAILLLGLTAFAFLQRNRRPWLATGWLWYLATLIPVLGLIQFESHGMADRHTYLPLIGIFICVAWGLAELCRENEPRRLTAVGLAVVLLAGCVTLSCLQIRQWKDSRTLFSHALDRQGPLAANLHGLGLTLLQEGDVDGALVHLRRAAEISPGNPVIETSLGKALMSKRDYYIGLHHLDLALAAAPRYAPAHFSNAMILVQTGEPEKALKAFDEVLRIRGLSPDAWEGIGTAFYLQGHYKEAVFNMQRAVLAKPQSMEFKNNLAWLFATCPEPSLRDGARSLMLAKEVTSSSAVPNAAYLDTLAAAYAETGQFDKAVEVTQQALDIATTNGDYKFSPDLEHRLRLYKNRMPYEEPDARKKQP